MHKPIDLLFLFNLKGSTRLVLRSTQASIRCTIQISPAPIFHLLRFRLTISTISIDTPQLHSSQSQDQPISGGSLLPMLSSSNRRPNIHSPPRSNDLSHHQYVTNSTCIALHRMHALRDFLGPLFFSFVCWYAPRRTTKANKLISFRLRHM